jgi:hypothetical protein
MRFVSRSLAVAAIAVLLGSTTAMAQSKISLGASGGYFSLSGDDYENTDAGFGFQGDVRFMASPNISVLAGFGYNMNSETDPTGGPDVDVNTIRILLQPRYMFRLTNSQLTPWVGGHVEWHQASADVSGSDVSANGFGFGGAGGVTWWASPTIGIEASVLFQSISFGDAEVDGQTVSGTDTSGTSLGIQVGVVIKLGGSGGGGM